MIDLNSLTEAIRKNREFQVQTAHRGRVRCAVSADDLEALIRIVEAAVQYHRACHDPHAGTLEMDQAAHAEWNALRDAGLLP